MTEPALRYLVDTNILLRVSRKSDPLHQLIGAALEELERQGAALYFSMQNIAEFWNVCTRPVDRNGYGLSVVEANRRVESIERRMTCIPDTNAVYSIWRQLVVSHNVRGVQVHDARLAAIMLAYGLTDILTLNQSDFLRYTNLNAIHPSQIQPAPR